MGADHIDRIVGSSYESLGETIRRLQTTDPSTVGASQAGPEGPEVTVAMPARNAARYILPAIAGVLTQDNVALELVVVDDASSDETARIVEAITDPRVRLVRNPTRRGIGYCHNRVLALSRAPFIAHVDADDLVLPGALSVMLARLRANPAAGQAFCYHFQVDAQGGLSREAYRRQQAARERVRPPGADYRRLLLLHGMVTNHLRTYRRDAVEAVGGFNENLPYAVDFEMAVRLADRFESVAIPEFLYCQRIHDRNRTATLAFKGLRFWWMRLTISRRLLDGQGRLLGRSPAQVYSLVGLGLLYVVGIPQLAKGALRIWRTLARAVAAKVQEHRPQKSRQ